jgi:hypothetical protein
MLTYSDLLQKGVFRCSFIHPNTGNQVIGQIVRVVGTAAIVQCPRLGGNDHEVKVNLDKLTFTTENAWGKAAAAVSCSFVHDDDFNDGAWEFTMTPEGMEIGEGILQVFENWAGKNSDKVTLRFGRLPDNHVVLIPFIGDEGDFKATNTVVFDEEDRAAFYVKLFDKLYEQSERYNILEGFNTSGNIRVFGDQGLMVGDNLIPYMKLSISNNWLSSIRRGNRRVARVTGNIETILRNG